MESNARNQWYTRFYWLHHQLSLQNGLWSRQGCAAFGHFPEHLQCLDICNSSNFWNSHFCHYLFDDEGQKLQETSNPWEECSHHLQPLPCSSTQRHWQQQQWSRSHPEPLSSTSALPWKYCDAVCKQALLLWAGNEENLQISLISLVNYDLWFVLPVVFCNIIAFALLEFFYKKLEPWNFLPNTTQKIPHNFPLFHPEVCQNV